MTMLKKKNSGFTLVETMVVASIFVFIIGGILVVFIAGRSSWVRAEAFLDTQQRARWALQKMAKELRPASSTALLSNHVTVSNTRFGDSLDAVRFDLPLDVNGDGWVDLDSGNIVYGAEGNRGWQIEYFLDAANHRIIRRILDNTTPPVEQSRQVAGISIHALDIRTDQTPLVGVPDQAVTIELTTEIDTFLQEPISPALQTTLNTRILLRN